MQVCPLQQDLTTEPVSDKISESSDLIPPRILQSVHGYFNLRCDHPTRLNLSASWDENTVSSLRIFFTFHLIPGTYEQPLTKNFVNIIQLDLMILHLNLS